MSYLGIKAIWLRAAQLLSYATSAPRVPSVQKVLQLLESREDKELTPGAQMDLVNGKKISSYWIFQILSIATKFYFFSTSKILYFILSQYFYI